MEQEEAKATEIPIIFFLPVYPLLMAIVNIARVCKYLTGVGKKMEPNPSHWDGVKGEELISAI